MELKVTKFHKQMSPNSTFLSLPISTMLERTHSPARKGLICGNYYNNNDALTVRLTNYYSLISITVANDAADLWFFVLIIGVYYCK